MSNTTLKNLTTLVAFHYKAKNNDTGSFHVGGQLPKAHQQNGSVPSVPLFIKVGDRDPKKVTYIMGSEKKGWSLCCKGAGRFEQGDLDCQVEILQGE